jgi:hypothetical protein
MPSNRLPAVFIVRRSAPGPPMRYPRVFQQRSGNRLSRLQSFGGALPTSLARNRALEIDDGRLGEVLFEQRREWARVVLGVPRFELGERRHDVRFRSIVFAR